MTGVKLRIAPPWPEYGCVYIASCLSRWTVFVAGKEYSGGFPKLRLAKEWAEARYAITGWRRVGKKAMYHALAEKEER